MIHSALMTSALLAQTHGAVSATQKAIIMSVSCLLILFLASRTIRYPDVGPKFPLGPFGPVLRNLSVASFIGAMSLGHIVGALAILAAGNFAN